MKPVQSMLLFVNKPTLALVNFSDSVNARLKEFDIVLSPLTSDISGLVTLVGGGLKLIVNFTPGAMPAESFRGALETTLSSPFRGILSDILFRHNRALVVTVKTDDSAAGDPDRLTQLRVAHAATTVLSERHFPAAVHWSQSNQLLVGSQYLRLSADPTPWALFASARTRIALNDDKTVRGTSLRLDEAIELIGRPVHFHATERPIDEVLAASLAFLRHAVESGTPVPDGDSFGLQDGRAVAVKHIKASPEMPRGRFDLRDLQPDEVSGSDPKPPNGTAKNANISLDLPSPYSDSRTVKSHKEDDSTRSMAMSFVMLLLMPPIGILLFVMNALFGPSTMRTGVVAASSVALALFVTAFTFLNYVGSETAVFIDQSPIETAVLAD